jgi:bifunctional DNase/RNase
MKELGNSLFVCALLFTFLMPARAAAAERAADPSLVQIEQIEVRASMVGPVVLLKAQQRGIPIFVDHVVAEGIVAALSGEQLPRPLTHNLMRSVLEAFEGKVSQVVITLKGTTFYADLTVVVRDTVKIFDSRSSDAVALAIHFKAPVLVSKQLLQASGIDIEQLEERKPGERRL